MNELNAPARRRLILALAAGASLPLVQGCAPLVVGGAATGAVVAYKDRRTSGAMVEDEGIEWRARSSLRNRFGSAANISVTSYNRVVLLTGQVPDGNAREEAGRLAAQVENVKGLVNELQVSGISSLSERSNDAMLTSMVKARLVDNQQVSANHVKVVTEAGVVYLMGLVTQAESEAATNVARNTRGVRKVVRVLEIISAEEAKRLDAASGGSSSSDNSN